MEAMGSKERSRCELGQKALETSDKYFCDPDERQNLDASTNQRDKLAQELVAVRSDLAGLSLAETVESDAVKGSGGSLSYSDYVFLKRLQSEKFSKEELETILVELETELDHAKEVAQIRQKRILVEQDRFREFSLIESEIEWILTLEITNKERDILEKELMDTRSKIADIKRKMPWQEMMQLDTRKKINHLQFSRDNYKRKMEEIEEKDKIAQLN